MTDNEIIKALEDCAKISKGKCGDMTAGALDLINRQKAEKEALINGQETLQKYISEQKAEIERLLTENHSFAIVQEGFKDMYKISQAEAIKEFADRFKGVFPCVAGMYRVHNELFDNLVKEMVGDGNGRR